jgi:DNA-binding CsgD family transcriptional regulator
LDKRQFSFGEYARQAMNGRRKIDEALYRWERIADEHPMEVCRDLYQTALYWRRVWTRQYRRRVSKGKRQVVLDNNEYVRFVTAEYTEPHEARRIVYALHKFTVWECAFRNMSEAGPAAKTVGEDPFRWACEGFFLAHRRSHELLYAITRPQWLGPELREEIAASLTGQVAARISLARNKRLAAALSEGSSSITDRLMQELPGATMYAWGSPPSDYKQPSLLREAVRLLEKQAKEQDRLAQAGKLAGELSESAGAEDEDIAEFERRETLQQDLNRLERWVEGAGFSDAEARVYELDIETNFDTGAIAQRLEISPSTVRGYRKRYIDKIRKVVGL